MDGTGSSSASNTASRIRDLRKPQYGGHRVVKRVLVPAVPPVWEYKLEES